MRKLILRNFQSAGDIVRLSAAVRDLHRCHPGEFLTDVRTSCSDVWLHNPHLTPLADDDPDVQVVDCHYPLIHRSNQEPRHFLDGFVEHLNEQLGLRIRVTDFRGDLHIYESEKHWFRRVEALEGECPPFWLLASGGKYDYTIKWWDAARYQDVVDLRGQTSLRELIRLVFHAQGALSAVSLLMHLTAAVEVKPGMPKNRPCVVVAGGREPPHFTAYPHHQFIHMVGALQCCDNGGCWKARTLPLGDGDVNDRPDALCVDVVGALPRCMDMISADDVIRRIELYFRGGALPLPPSPGVHLRHPDVAGVTARGATSILGRGQLDRTTAT